MSLVYGVLTVIVLTGISLFGLAVYAITQARQLPDNRPTPAFVASQNQSTSKTIVVCAGDSITHGRVGANYVERVRQQLPADQYVFYNAGINSDLSFTLLRRLDDIVAAQPNLVTILIGTNDVMATISDAALNRYRSKGKIQIGDEPSIDTYRQNVRAIIKTVKAQTRASVAVLSLPLITENFSDPANQHADAYSAVLAEIAAEEEITYLPLCERQKAYLAQHPYPAKKTALADTRWLMTRSIFGHYAGGRSWDALTRSHGNQLTFDNLHQSDIAADQIAELVCAFLERPVINS